MSQNKDGKSRLEPEVTEKAGRRRFTAEYKARILEAADRCTEPGQLGELLRREGLYSSHLANWRRQRDEGLAPKRRGRKPVLAKMDKSPYQVYAKLLDDGQYLCSVRTMYRILGEDEASRERRRQLRHPNYKKPELIATAPNQVWSWDITKLKGAEKWRYYYLYVILDIFSRYVVGWMVAHREQAELATRLIRETVTKQGVCQDELIVHSDRGPSMTSHSVAQLLIALGVTKSHSRPHVSNDNPFSESQFKTMKYRPEFPERFGCYEDAAGFCRRFFSWYNDEHYHSGIGYVTPALLHYGEATSVLAARHKTLKLAYEAHPERFVRGTPKPWPLPEAVWINPPSREKEKRLPEIKCPRKPKEEAPLTHPRSDYPSASCVPAELASVSSDEINIPACSPLNTRAMPKKNPGGLGAGPQGAQDD